MTSLTRQIVRALEMQAMTAVDLAFMLDYPLGSVRSAIFDMRKIGYVRTTMQAKTAFYELTAKAPHWSEMLNRKRPKTRKDKKEKPEAIVVSKAPTTIVRALANRHILQTVWGGM